MERLLGASPPRVPTARLAFVGFTVFVSGFFVLAAAGRTYGFGTLALVLAGAVALTLPLAAFTQLVAASEGLVGRAWGAGFRRLNAADRAPLATAERGLRYAGVLWLANGLALWFATLASQLGG
ncbi:MAG: hypothetical protein Q8M79_02035 [Dehalococcoidia bacterium]|nr:hypothetical protein [Dehalococcoidia bacterium]